MSSHLLTSIKLKVKKLRQATDRKKVFATSFMAKGVTSRMHRELSTQSKGSR